MKFEFDPAKSASNKRKHGLDFIEAQALWSDQRVEVQAKTEGREIRYANLGIIGGIHHTVIVTYRSAMIRIISARKSATKEIEIYEQYKK